MQHFRLASIILLAGTALQPLPLIAQTDDVLLRDSFPIGSDDGVLCQVQDVSAGNPARQSAYDRAWSVVCRDSARPVANVYAFRNPSLDPDEMVAPRRETLIDCDGPFGPFENGVSRRVCSVPTTQLEYSQFRIERGGTVYFAEGFSAYDSATVLALRSVYDNAIAQGRIDAATTSVKDPAAFARVQAETLTPEQALIEGYRRNLGGDYAEAATYFETLQYRAERDEDSDIHPSELVLNRALQKSNLGDFAEAEELFALGGQLAQGNAIGERLLRNFEAMHLLNRGAYGAVEARLARPLQTDVERVSQAGDAVAINVPLAARLNANAYGGLVEGTGSVRLTPAERAEIIDAQALQIGGTAARLLGQDERARSALMAAQRRSVAVREGRVTSIVRLRSQILGELGLLDERAGNLGAAERYFRSGLALLETQYPERTAVMGAKARLAAFLLRNGHEGEAVTLYEQVVDRALEKTAGATGIGNHMNPYFRYLADRPDDDATSAAQFFRASQLLVRPGIAETQAVFARELSGGSDAASRLFRQSLDLSREIESKRVRFLALARADQTPESAMRSAELEMQIAALEERQMRTQAQLAEYPQYRVVANRAIALGEFQQLLGPDEAYARLTVAGNDLFMVFASTGTAKVWRVPLSQEDLDYHVDMLRASISLEQGGQYLTYPFDIGMARDLFTALFAPAAGELADVGHLIFEPDGAMLRLPVDLLVTDDASLDRYAAQAESDEYDFTGVAWLGRDRRISTAVSAQGFADARRARGSSARRGYLGLGENTPVASADTGQVRAAAITGSANCGWNIVNWNRPIDDGELEVARAIVGEGASQVVTGDAFTDTRIKARGDLDQFRILHFATHGLVTPPRPECPVQPALLTSFGEGDSDGLLTFSEIFDLDLDADVIILSACDTAAGASIEATREAGLTSGGGTALDGLVRAFVGAGGRSVLASHWVAPDDYRATERLMSEMFRAGRTMSLGAALKHSQRQLMDDRTTSHPYYWSGFALIGDGEKPLLGPGDGNGGAQAAARIANAHQAGAE